MSVDLPVIFITGDGDIRMNQLAVEWNVHVDAVERRLDTITATRNLDKPERRELSVERRSAMRAELSRSMSTTPSAFTPTQGCID